MNLSKTFALFGLLILIILASCNSVNKNSSESSDKVKFIENFYTEYLLALNQVPMNFDSIQNIKLKYCSKDLLEKFETNEMYHDPFINAQDFEDDIRDKLNIEIDSTDEKTIIVRYTDNYSNTDLIIELKLIEFGNTFKINGVENN